MNNKNKSIIYLILGLLLGAGMMHFCSNYSITKKNNQPNAIPQNETKHKAKTENSEDISQLTNENVVIPYVKEHHQLPDYYITKSEAKNLGWHPGESLCDAVAGKAIGGDHFSNREKQLPQGEQYFEADVNYSCGHRNTDRIIFTKNGDVWLTHDHYKTFQKQ